MKEMALSMKITASAAVGWLSVFFGGFDSLFYALLAFCVIDYVSGVAVAVKEKSLDSNVGFIGIARKAMIFAVCGVSSLMDGVLWGGEHALRSAVMFFYLSNEGISILENASAVGVPIPKKLKNVLAQLREK